MTGALWQQTDVLALATGLVHDPTDPGLLDEDAVWALMDDLEQANPLHVALAAAGLISRLARDLAEARSELTEDVLRQLALSAAMHLPPAPTEP